MSPKTSSVPAPVLVVLAVAMTGCGHYPSAIRSAHDIERASSSENMVVLRSLPLEDWPKLQKFVGLEHFRIGETMAAEVQDEHMVTLSRLKLPILRQISLAHCSRITDHGIESLQNLTSVQGLQLNGVGLTDGGMRTLATQFPHLTGINVEECRLLTAKGFMNLTNSKTITDVGLTFEPFSQEQMENIISTVSNVTWWSISDPRHRLDSSKLKLIARERGITIQVVDENIVVTNITPAQPGAAPNAAPPHR